MTNDQSRRAFLKRSAALGIAGAASPFVVNLAAIGEAAAASATDYKALVCVFLYGGNDYANTLPPYSADTSNIEPNYAAYLAARGGTSTLGFTLAQLAPTALNPVTPLAGGRQFALAPGLAPMLGSFNTARKLAVVLNVGTLVQPTSKLDYQFNRVKLPPKIFSHNDQQAFWQSSNPEGATTGWGGRIGDLLQSGNGTAATLTCINPSGNAVFLTGKDAVQYSIATTGPIALTARTNLFGSANSSAVLQRVMKGSTDNAMQLEHAKVTTRALATYANLSTQLAKAPAFATAYPANNALASQLNIVAKMISVNQDLGVKRQVFFVSLGGFDTHDGLVTNHPGLMDKVSRAMQAFYDTTVELGVQNQVTTFTGSDFGRTLTVNTDGSDHGWGSMHFVLGGAVNGGEYYGKVPMFGNNADDDVGSGRLLPTISVDQYAYTLARWFGVPDSVMDIVVPNIGNYRAAGDYAGWNLGFVPPQAV